MESNGEEADKQSAGRDKGAGSVQRYRVESYFHKLHFKSSKLCPGVCSEGATTK